MSIFLSRLFLTIHCTYLFCPFNAKQVGSSDNATEIYSGGEQFVSQSIDHALSVCFVVFLSSSR